MTDTAVTSRTITAGALTAALDSTSTAGTSVATGEYAVFTPAGGGNTRDAIFTFYGSGAATVTFIAGDEPPSENAGLGNGSALTVASGKAYLTTLPAGRYVQDNGTVRALIGGTGPVICNVFTNPRTV